MKATPELLKIVEDARADGRVLRDSGCRWPAKSPTKSPKKSPALSPAKKSSRKSRKKSVAGDPFRCAVPAESEAEFTRRVIEYAHFHGWKVAHFRGVRVQRADGSCYHQTPVQADGAGFPDLVLVHPTRNRVVYAELKVGCNTPSESQKEWLAWLEGSGQYVRVWYPENWASIDRLLAGR